MSASLALDLSAPLESTRLQLEPLLAGHAAAFFEPLQDDAVYQWISMDKPTTVETLAAGWKRGESRLSPDGLYSWPCWALRRKSDGRYIGRVDAEVNAALEAINVGYYLFAPMWGQGFATEAVVAVTQHLIQQGVRRMVATVTVGNTASARVLHKAGFAFARILVANDTVAGVLVDDEEYVHTGPEGHPLDV